MTTRLQILDATRLRIRSQLAVIVAATTTILCLQTIGMCIVLLLTRLRCILSICLATTCFYSLYCQFHLVYSSYDSSCCFYALYLKLIM
jgi:hypothetical protein